LDTDRLVGNFLVRWSVASLTVQIGAKKYEKVNGPLVELYYTIIGNSYRWLGTTFSLFLSSSLFSFCLGVRIHCPVTFSPLVRCLPLRKNSTNNRKKVNGPAVELCYTIVGKSDRWSGTTFFSVARALLLSSSSSVLALLFLELAIVVAF
jgi:hypothetical protein